MEKSQGRDLHHDTLPEGLILQEVKKAPRF